MAIKNLTINQWALVLNYIHMNQNRKDININATTISKSLDITHSHCGNLIEYLKKEKYVETTKKGRLNLVKLTKDGELLAHYISKTITVLNLK